MPSFRLPKITIIGGGNVGTCCALWAGIKELGNIVVIDVPQAEKEVKGHMLDLQEAATIELFDAHLTVTTNYEELKESDVVILTAGNPIRPGMSREELLHTNCEIVKGACEKIKQYAPDSIVIVVSDPMDAMVYVAWKVTGFPHHRIIGHGACLDVARLKAFISMETGFSVEDINAMSLGHGEHLVPLRRFTNISGIPVDNFLAEDKMTDLWERTKKGSREIEHLTGTSAYIAPASGTIQMVEAIVRDKRRILPCTGYCKGEYGVSDLFLGVPCVLGRNGVEKVVAVDLNEEEKHQLRQCTRHISELVDKVKNKYPDVA